MERARRSLDASCNLPAPWRSATHVSNTVSVLTADELTALTEEVRAVLDRYRDKRRPGDRPEGAMPVELLFFGYPLTDFMGPDQG